MQRIIIRDRYIPITRTRTVSATVLTGNETTLAEGWYVVADDIKYTSTVFASGDINLILCDGKKMSIATTNANGFKSENNSLTIYGQNADSGILDVGNNNSTKGIHAIYVTKDITINGGHVIANSYGSWNSSAILVSNGTLTRTSTPSAALPAATTAIMPR